MRSFALLTLWFAAIGHGQAPAQGDANIDQSLDAITRSEDTSSIVQRIALLRNINESSSQGYTVLMGVSRTSPERMDLFAEVIKRNPNIEARSATGESALLLAAAAGNDNVVRALVSRSASLEARSTQWGTPITIAALNQRWSTVELLMSAGSNLDVPDIGGRTPIDFACIAGRWDLAARLLGGGCLAQPCQ